VSAAAEADQDPGGLVTLFHEGERLRASILWSGAAILGDLMRGAARQKQIERERLARDWDRRVREALPEQARAGWTAAGTLPERTLEHVTTINGVREFLAAKLLCLKEIVADERAQQTQDLKPFG
jgi:hypothetical protein